MPIYINILLPIFWLSIHYQTVLWFLKKVVARPDALLLLFLIIAAIGFVFSKLRITTYSSIARLPLVLFFVVAALTALNSITIEFYQLQVTFLLLGIYAWLGLQASIWHQWQKTLNIAILLSLAIPFYLEFSSGLGFGLRLATAYLVEQTLHILGFNAVSSHDVIITENAIAHIDIPCSGLKSLWIGSAFYLAALVVLGVRITWNVLWKYIVVMVLLLSANTFRVLILTLLTSIYNMPDIAEILHVPLGILGFTLSCLVGWFLLRYVPERGKMLSEPYLVKPRNWLVGLLGLFLLQLLIIAGETNDAESVMRVRLIPSTIEASPIPLTTEEKRYFSRGEETIAEKWLFDWKGETGSVLVVHSRDFNMFHAPELCMAASGIAVDSMQTIHIGDNSFRLLSLNGGSATGVYWLQSDEHATDDFTTRYLQYIINNKKNWRMISMVLQIPYPPDRKAVEDLIRTIYKNGKGMDDEVDTFTQ